MSSLIEEAFGDMIPTRVKRDAKGSIVAIKQKPSNPKRTEIPLTELGLVPGQRGGMPKTFEN